MTFVSDPEIFRADGTKRCSKCGEYKLLREFPKASREKSGYQSACKSCRKALYQSSQMKKRMLRYAADPQWLEKQKASAKASHQKYRNRYSAKQRDRYRADESVRRAAVERAEKWRLENPDSVKVYFAKKRSKEVAAKGGFTRDDVKRLLEKQRFKCVYCGGDISGGLHTIEHVIPLSRGGSNGLENIALACRSCNARKGDKLVTEFFETRRR